MRILHYQRGQILKLFLIQITRYFFDNLKGLRLLECDVYKAKEQGKMSRFFGKWNKRYLTLNLESMQLYYVSKPGKDDKKYIPLKVSQIQQISKIPLKISKNLNKF